VYCNNVVLLESINQSSRRFVRMMWWPSARSGTMARATIDIPTIPSNHGKISSDGSFSFLSHTCHLSFV
jgi:hypothetical protein